MGDNTIRNEITEKYPGKIIEIGNRNERVDEMPVKNRPVVCIPREGSDGMEDLLKSYIEKADRDQSDLRTDIRESEKRLESHAVASEKRMEDRIIQIAELIKDQNKKFDKMEDKTTLVSIEVQKGLDEYRRFMWGIAASIFTAILGMIISLIVA